MRAVLDREIGLYSLHPWEVTCPLVSFATNIILTMSKSRKTAAVSWVLVALFDYEIVDNRSHRLVLPHEGLLRPQELPDRLYYVPPDA